MTRLERYVGQVLDEKYRLERLLGQGGMGAVYLATHLGTERYVALKLITPQFMRNEEFVERFKREARAAGRLRHPNVVDVTDFGFAHVGVDRVAYLVMEYLDGCTLGDVLSEEKRLPLDWVVDILEQVCSAVHEAHQQGIVHRDLKPDNIWLEPNRLGGYRIKVLDFGIAKLAEGGAATAQPLTASVSAAIDDPGSHSPMGPGVSLPQQTGSATSRPGGSADLEMATLIYDDGSPAAGHTLNQADEAATQNFSAGAQMEQHDGKNAAETAAYSSSDAVNTQLFGTPFEGTHQTAAAAAVLSTQAVVDGDQTLMFGETTQRQAMGGHTVSSSATARGAGLTRVGAIMGTPLYMSPEQCRSAKLDARSDVYSLGIIAYQMLAGDLPFTGDTTSVMTGHLETAPAPLRDRNPKISKRAAGIVMSALAKDPADRPQTAFAFASSLRAHADGVGSMYRRAFALYSEYFPKFLRISLIAHIPVIVFTMILLALDLSEPSWSHGSKATKVVVICFFVVVGLLQIVSYFLAGSAISGMTAVIVTQLSVAPLRPVELRTAFALVKRRWRPFLNTSIRLMLRLILSFMLFIIPGFFVMVRYFLWAPVVLMEGLDKKAARLRARELGARSWRTVITVCALQFFIPMVISGLLSAAVGRVSMTKTHTGVTLSLGKASQHLVGLANIFIVPLMSIVPALLYLKMRQLGGETLVTALEQIEEAKCDRSQWQQRMRSRLMVTPPSGQTPRSGA
jgi:serine/threonine protein kinase